MRVDVRLFAAARECVGRAHVEVELRMGATILELRRVLVADYPVLGPVLARSLIAVNNEFGLDEQVLAGIDEIAVIPPVSGGQLDGDCSWRGS